MNVLVQEPFNLSPEEVGGLCPFQVRHVYFRDKDEDLTASPDDPGAVITPAEKQALLEKRGSALDAEKALFMKVEVEWRGRQPHEAEVLWREHLQRRERERA